MEILVTQDNIQKLMIAIVEQYKENVQSNKLVDADSIISNILELTTNGTGSKILSNNGNYKDLKKSDIDTLIDKFNTIQSIISISKIGEKYQISFPEYSDIQIIVNKILASGEGNKLYSNSGEYIDIVVCNAMNTTDITNMINQIRDGE